MKGELQDKEKSNLPKLVKTWIYQYTLIVKNIVDVGLPHTRRKDYL